MATPHEHSDHDSRRPTHVRSAMKPPGAGKKGTNLTLWDMLRPIPLGKWVFAQGLSFKAPYFRTIRPSIVELRPSSCTATIRNTRRVHNHLGTVHAIAACNLAELVAGLMTDATVPASHRWIPKGMTVEYLHKATTDLTAHATLDEVPEFGARPFEIVVPVTICDTDGRPVVGARITMHVSPMSEL